MTPQDLADIKTALLPLITTAITQALDTMQTRAPQPFMPRGIFTIGSEGDIVQLVPVILPDALVGPGQPPINSTFGVSYDGGQTWLPTGSPAPVPGAPKGTPPVRPAPPAPVPTPIPVVPGAPLMLVGSFKETNAKGAKVFNPRKDANDQTVHDGDIVSQGGLTFKATVVSGPLGVPEISFTEQ